MVPVGAASIRSWRPLSPTVPAVTLDERYKEAVKYIPDGADNENHRHEMVVRKRFARVLDGVAETRRHPEELRRHEHDPRDAEREANAGDNVERDRRHDNLHQDVPRLGAEIARHLEPGRVH